MTNLADRGLKRIQMAIVDGNKGLTRALLELWPNLPIQRCTVHKLWNLLGHAPKSLQGEVKADYDTIINADGVEQRRRRTARSCASGAGRPRAWRDRSRTAGWTY